MTDRIDHAAAARRLLTEVASRFGGPDAMPLPAEGFLAAAQVHATLALVEQQRIDAVVKALGLAVEYQVVNAAGEVWAWTDTLRAAQHYLSQEPDGRIERRLVTEWEVVPDAG